MYMERRDLLDKCMWEGDMVLELDDTLIHAEPSRVLFGHPVGGRLRLRWESFAERRHPQSGHLELASPAGAHSPPALGGHLGWPSVAGGNAFTTGAMLSTPGQLRGQLAGQV